MGMTFVRVEARGHLNQQEEDDQGGREGKLAKNLLRKQPPELPNLASLPLFLLLHTLEQVFALSEGVQSVALLLGEFHEA